MGGRGGRKIVLILVLMEDALGDVTAKELQDAVTVLILVLMEDALGARPRADEILRVPQSLNPCFNGRCSRSAVADNYENLSLDEVLILVLMEDALGG